MRQPTLDQSFGYDELGRLSGVTRYATSWSIAYDANGNRTSVSTNGSPSVYTTSATSNRLSAITNPARSFGHDAAGNTVSDSTRYTATYSLENRLATLTQAGVNTTYSYDAHGQRIRKVSSTGSSTTVIFVYDPQGQLLGEYDQNGQAIREYVWLGATPIAMFTPNGSSAPTVYYIHADHLDTPRVVVDRDNRLRWRWMVEPFGLWAPENDPSALSAFTLNLRFPGQYFDSESGLHYNYFRDYDSSVGRYVQSDPIGLAGGDQYLQLRWRGSVELRRLRWLTPVFNGREVGGSGNVNIHAYAGPQAGGTEHGRWGAGNAYHVHVTDAAGNNVRVGVDRSSTGTYWRPLTPADARHMTDICDA